LQLTSALRINYGECSSASVAVFPSAGLLVEAVAVMPTCTPSFATAFAVPSGVADGACSAVTAAKCDRTVFDDRRGGDDFDGRGCGDGDDGRCVGRCAEGEKSCKNEGLKCERDHVSLRS
jgi:hypothetical protein